MRPSPVLRLTAVSYGLGATFNPRWADYAMLYMPSKEANLTSPIASVFPYRATGDISGTNNTLRP